MAESFDDWWPTTPYRVLRLSDDCTADEGGQARKTFARRAHPDRQGDEELMKRANAAADLLLDPARRANLDAFIANKRAEELRAASAPRRRAAPVPSAGRTPGAQLATLQAENERLRADQRLLIQALQDLSTFNRRPVWFRTKRRITSCLLSLTAEPRAERYALREGVDWGPLLLPGLVWVAAHVPSNGRLRAVTA